MAFYTQLFEQNLNPVSGYDAMGHPLQKIGPVLAGETIVSGRVASIDPTTKSFVLGAADSAVPCFVAEGTDRLANQTETAVAGVYGAASSVSYGNGKGITVLPATGAYELQTTEFVGSLASYTPNTPLTVENSVPSDKGKVKAGVYYTDDICGVVSTGDAAYDGLGKVPVLTLLTYFLPKAPSEG